MRYTGYALISLHMLSACVVAGDGPIIIPQGDNGSSSVMVFDIPATVLVVRDGDTVEVVVDSDLFVIRIIGINAPELYATGGPEPFAEAAQAFTLALVSDRVGLELDDPACTPPGPAPQCYDIYDRLLAYVRTQAGNDLGAELLAHGLAEVYDSSFSRKSAYQQLQAEAMAAGVGIWSQ